MNKNRVKYLIVSLLGIVLLTSCYESAWEKHTGNTLLADKNLMEAVSAKPELSVFASLLKKTGYDQLLQSSNSFTVFAPQNEAWSGIDTTNTETLTKMIGVLIIYNTYFTDNDELFKSVTSVNGKKINYDAASQRFNGAKIISADVVAANGVIQVMDKLVERRENIWDYLKTQSDNNQFKFINSLNRQVMDMEKSVQIGVYPDGKTKYDTAWMNMNSFLESYRLDNEDSVFTYVIIENDGFNSLYSRYKPYFRLSNEAKTDSVTRFNVCQDFVFRGMIDVAQYDTLINVDNVKIPVRGAVKIYEASNGRVYKVSSSEVRLKEKIKPVKIEGENFNSTYSRDYILTRFKRWASGERDVVLACGETQSDTLWRPSTGIKDSVASKTYFINSGIVSNVNNFYIEYKAKVNSVNYDVYYVAYDDIADHFDHSYTSFGVLNVTQKLFVSMPGSPLLKHGITDNTRGVANNYLGETQCFIGQTKAGIHELTKLRRWNLFATTQLMDTPVSGAAGEVMTVPNTGTMTMWLCNTARSNAASRQGLLFLDYILLVPRITEN